MNNTFELSARQKQLQRAAREFVRQQVVPDSRTLSQLGTVEERFLATKPIYKKMVQAGYLRLFIPQEVGGDSEGLIEAAMVAEELFCGNPSIALTLIGTVLGLYPIIIGGTNEQRNRLLQPFLSCEGAPLAAFCSTEPGGSSNAGGGAPDEGVRTTAQLEGQFWKINGRKKWISSATGWNREGADLLTVVCRTDIVAASKSGISILAVPRPIEGLIFERAIDTIGFRAHLTPEFSLNNVVTSNKNRIGLEGEGLQLAGASFMGATALVGIMAVALMRSAFEYVYEFSRREKRGGTLPIIDHQAIGYALVDAKMKIEAVRAFSIRACQAIDAKTSGADELANLSKIFASETSVEVIAELMRIVGIESFDQNEPLASLMNDALALPIFAGGNMGVRRKRVYGLIKGESYDPLAASNMR